MQLQQDEDSDERPRALAISAPRYAAKQRGSAVAGDRTENRSADSDRGRLLHERAEVCGSARVSVHLAVRTANL